MSCRILSERRVLWMLMVLLSASATAKKLQNLKTHKYEEDEKIELYASKVGPYDNLRYQMMCFDKLCDICSETYRYYSFPFCPAPEGPIKAFGRLGELLEGDRFVRTRYDIHFKSDDNYKILCQKNLTSGDIEKFRYAIQNGYYYQVHIQKAFLPFFFVLDVFGRSAFLGIVWKTRSGTKFDSVVYPHSFRYLVQRRSCDWRQYLDRPSIRHRIGTRYQTHRNGIHIFREMDRDDHSFRTPSGEILKRISFTSKLGSQTIRICFSFKTSFLDPLVFDREFLRDSFVADRISVNDSDACIEKRLHQIHER